MTANINTASYKSASGSQTRTLGVRAEDVINVKDFGAVGNGIADDTASIQAAFDVAFGTWGSTRGANSNTANKAVFFPNGTYNVSARSALKTITGTSSLGNTTASSSGGYVRLSFGSAHGLSDGDVVYIRNVGGTVAANGSHQISEASSVNTAFTLPMIAFDSAWTAGGTAREPALRIHNVQGGRIYGAGKFATRIANTSSNCATITAFGFGFSHVSDISWASEGGGIAFDCNGNGQSLPTTATDPVSCQSNLFVNCTFGGTASVTGDYGVTIGSDQQMGSEITFLDNYIATGSIAGIAWMNFNALSGTVIGGNIGGSSGQTGSGILVAAGACPTIQGVGFQNFDGIDINITNGAGDAYIISGCRTESNNFVQGPAVTNMSINIVGCALTTSSLTDGLFYSGGCSVNIDGCQSNGPSNFVNGQNASVVIRNTTFVATDYLSRGSSGGHPTNYNYLEVIPQPQITVTSTESSIPSYHGGHLISYSNAAAMKVVIPPGTLNRLSNTPGAFVDVKRAGAGTVTFSSTAGVTINARGALRSLNGQNAIGRLVSEGSDTWTLSGDLV